MTRSLLFAALAVAVAPAGFAQTYIVADGDCGAVTLHATSGTDFPNLGSTINAQSVTRAYVYVPKQRIAVQPVAAPRSLDFSADIPASGVVMATMELAPVTTGNETHTEEAKAMIRCGTPTNKDDWQIDTGLALEIVPQWNGLLPLKAGQRVGFVGVAKHVNRPVYDAPMTLQRAGDAHVLSAMPNRGGVAYFTLPGSGRYMVTMTYRRADPENTGRWLTDTSTLTFEAQ